MPPCMCFLFRARQPQRLCTHRLTFAPFSQPSSSNNCRYVESIPSVAFVCVVDREAEHSAVLQGRSWQNTGTEGGGSNAKRTIRVFAPPTTHGAGRFRLILGGSFW